MKESKMLEMIINIKKDSYDKVKKLPLEKQIDEILNECNITVQKLGVKSIRK